MSIASNGDQNGAVEREGGGRRSSHLSGSRPSIGVSISSLEEGLLSPVTMGFYATRAALGLTPCGLLALLGPYGLYDLSKTGGIPNAIEVSVGFQICPIVEPFFNGSL
jgi:hypothetical protein